HLHHAHAVHPLLQGPDQHGDQADLLRQAVQAAHARGAAAVRRRDAPAGPSVLTDPGWAAVPGLHHGFLARAESAGAGTSDWDRALQATGIALPIATVRQVHGTRVVTAASDRGPQEADGIATGTRGPAAGGVPADCGPELLRARWQATAVAVHAGWRGAAAGVLESAL